jgi:hypothetical protein
MVVMSTTVVSAGLLVLGRPPARPGPPSSERGIVLPVKGRIDSKSPGARRLARAYLDEIDTVQVRVREGRQYRDHEDVGPGPPAPVVRRENEVFLLQRRRLGKLLELGVVELA